MPRPLWDRKPRLKNVAAEERDPKTDAATVKKAEKAAKPAVDRVKNAMTEAFKKKPKKGGK